MTEPGIDPDKTYTLGKAAALIGCSRSALRQRIDGKVILATRLPTVNGGKTWWRVAGAELLRLKGQVLLADQARPKAADGGKPLNKALSDLGLD